jgi:hypothetical protein
MTTVTEAVTAKPSLGADLAAGIDVLSATQTITFYLYKKMVLPLDGFMFWINYNLLIPSPNDPPATINIQGSLHYSTDVMQEETSSISMNTIVFTALTQCDSFQEVDPEWLYLADYNGIRFAFNSQGKYYQQADLWHYVGIAVTSVMGTQVVDTQEQLDSLSLVVSNSLPIWLAMPTYVPPYPGFTCPIQNIYPSYLIPSNEKPPYAAVHIEDTNSLAETAFLGPKLTSTQLSSETVRVTTYGVNNDDIITFLNFVNQYSYDWNYIGMMNMPIVRDEKLIQTELNTIAQKKTIEFKVSYLQNSVRNVARQHILKSRVQLPGAAIPKGTYIVVPTARLDFIRILPIVNQSTGLCIPPSASIIISNYEPIVIVPRGLVPNSISAGLVSTVPNINLPYNIYRVPSSSLIGLINNQPIVTKAYNLSPISRSSILHTTTSIINWTNSIWPASITVSLSASAPIIGEGYNLLPNTKYLSIIPTIPNAVIVTSQTFSPNEQFALLNLTTPIISISSMRNIIPNSKNLVIASTTPNVNWTNNVSSIPAVKSLTLSIRTPSISWTNSIWTVPAVKSLTLTNYTSIISRTNNVILTPNNESGSISSTQPIVDNPSSISVSPDAVSINLDVSIPDLGALPPYQLGMPGGPIIGGFD